ncbi:MAG TPA: class I SAM-dependent methyltransferase [Acidimicrobiales bacterium]|nr:class I SAM-dependent methyltransferase [Acidimicrobiales bacterium]
MTRQLESVGTEPTPLAARRPPEAGLSTADRETSAWFAEHYGDAADQIISFFENDGISMAGHDIADVGCGDGIIDLGLALKSGARSVVGFDIAPTDPDWLLRRAKDEGVADQLPDNLEFRTCEPRRLPADDDSFDFVVTWSAFEHIEDPVAVLREIRRILRPHGILFLQIWPLYHSEHGAHLWQCIPDHFVHHLRSDDEIKRAVRACTKHSPEQAEEFLEVFDELNRVTLDDLQRAMLAAGIRVAKLELQSESIQIPPELARRSLTQLGISGVKLLAVLG